MAVLQSKVTNPIFQGTYAFAVTPSDTVNISADAANTKQKEAVTLYIGASGDVKVITADGQTVTFVGLQAGSFIPMLVTRVFATSPTPPASILGIA